MTKTHPALKLFSDEKMQEFRTFASAVGVQVTFNRRRAHDQLIGSKHPQCLEKLQEMILQVADEGGRRLGRSEARALWWYQLPDESWKKFEAESCSILEGQYTNRPRAEKLTVPVSKDALAVDFRTMQLDWSDGTSSKIKRVEFYDELPIEWDLRLNEAGFKKVKLNPKSKEYQTVSGPMIKSAPTMQITEIWRVENPIRYTQYLVQKRIVEDEVKKRGLQNIPVERDLYHATKAVNFDSICLNGFDRGYKGANGQWYGEGSYFAAECAYSINPKYCPDKKLFVAKVLTGEYGLGAKGTRVPQKGGRDLYHSLVDDMNRPKEFIVFTDVSAYPAYIVSFQ